MKDEIRELFKLSDEELMIEYKLGNAKAFSLLYQRHQDKVYGYLSNKLYSKAQADDVFQECFFKVHKFRAKYDTSFPFLPWLFTICRNALVDYLRRTKSNREQSLEENQDMTHDGGILQQELTEGLKNLSAKESNVVQLHYLQGYSFNEVASYLKIQPASARKISSRAIQKLKSFWKQEV